MYTHDFPPEVCRDQNVIKDQQIKFRNVTSKRKPNAKDPHSNRNDRPKSGNHQLLGQSQSHQNAYQPQTDSSHFDKVSSKMSNANNNNNNKNNVHNSKDKFEHYQSDRNVYQDPKLAVKGGTSLPDMIHPSTAPYTNSNSYPTASQPHEGHLPPPPPATNMNMSEASFLELIRPMIMNQISSSVQQCMDMHMYNLQQMMSNQLMYV